MDDMEVVMTWYDDHGPLLSCKHVSLTQASSRTLPSLVTGASNYPMFLNSLPTCGIIPHGCRYITEVH